MRQQRPIVAVLALQRSKRRHVHDRSSKTEPTPGVSTRHRPDASSGAGTIVSTVLTAFVLPGLPASETESLISATLIGVEVPFWK